MDVKFCVADPSGTVTAVGSCVDVRVSLNDTDVPRDGQALKVSPYL